MALQAFPPPNAKAQVGDVGAAVELVGDFLTASPCKLLGTFVELLRRYAFKKACACRRRGSLCTKACSEVHWHVRETLEQVLVQRTTWGEECLQTGVYCFCNCLFAGVFKEDEGQLLHIVRLVVQQLHHRLGLLFNDLLLVPGRLLRHVFFEFRCGNFVEAYQLPDFVKEVRLHL